MIDKKFFTAEKANIKQNIIDLRQILSDLTQNIDSLEKSTDEYNRECLKENPYIVKRVVRHIANGMNRHDAILLAAKELQVNTSRVEVLFSYQKKYMSALLLFSRKYTAEKMKVAGYTAKQISAVLGVSENHIYKLLKSVPNEWILSR